MTCSTRFTAFEAAAAFAGFAIGVANWTATVPAQAQQAQKAAAPSTVTAAGITLHSVSIELPSSDRMFPGDADAEAINTNCLACHSAGMVLNQPNLTRADWQQEVEKMRTLYKAPVNETDEPAIVAYLASHKGAK
jgi:hypothetical protein